MSKAATSPKARKGTKKQPQPVRGHNEPRNEPQPANTTTGKSKQFNNFLSAAAQSRILGGLLILYVIMVSYGIMNHELWRDEGCDWMAVRDLSFGSLMRWYVPQGGHPPLYYIILFPLAKMGLPLKTVNIVSLVFMTVSLYILFFKTKLPFFFKLALVFSYFFLFEYGIIGRNYCIVVFFTSLTISFYPHRFEKPWIYALILLCLLNSDSLMFPFSMAIVFIYWLELFQQKKLQLKYILPATLMTIGGLYIIPYIAMGGIRSQLHIAKIPDHFAEISKTISGAFILYNDSMIILSIFLVLLILLACRPKALFMLLCGAVGILYLLAYVRTGEVRHSGILLLEIIAAFGIGVSYGNETGGSLKRLATDGKKMITAGFTLISCFLVYQTIVGIQVWKQDVDSNFSGSKEAADYIIDNNLQHRIIISQPSWAASSVMQYLPRDCKLYYADCQRYGTFIIYDSLYEANQFRFSSNYGPFIAEQNFHDSMDKVLLLLNNSITNKKVAKEWNLLYYTKDTPMKKQESFYIYERKKQLASMQNERR